MAALNIDRAIIGWPWLPHAGLPANGSLHGAALDRHLLLNLWIGLALLGLAHGILLAGLIARRDDGARNRWRTEYLPLMALTLLFGGLTLRAERLWAATRYTGADPAALQVEVTGMQFAWYFRYPGEDAIFGRTAPELVAPAEGNPTGLDPADEHGADDIVSAELVLPIDREVDLRLRAQDVIHGFSVPALRLKQNAVPGQTIHVHFTPTVAGTYAVLCTQVCGTGHFRMQANLRVVDAAGYRAWLAQHARPVAQ